MPRFDLLVIGGGFGGYPAAVVAAQRGLKTAVVEARLLGGECANYACIPVKAMLSKASEIAAVLSRGFSVDKRFREALEYALKVSQRVRSGIETVLEGYGVAVIRGRAKIRAPGVVHVEGYGDVEYEKLVIATGTDPGYPPGLEPDGKLVHDNRTILSYDGEPSKVVVVGGGPAGVEYADLFARLGAEVHLVEVLDRILPFMDVDLSRAVARYLRSIGVKLHTKTTIGRLEKLANGVEVVLSSGDRIKADIVVVATGRRPATSGLGLDVLGVKLDEKGYIIVDEYLRAAKDVYASGDVAGPPLLAHKAYSQAVTVGLNVSGEERKWSPKAIPLVVYTGLEAVQVGYTLDEARRRGYNAQEARIRLGAISMAVIKGAEYGVAKIVYDASSGRVLGLHLAAHGASEVAGEAALAVERGVTVEELADLIHPHPSISEAIALAAEVAVGRPVNYLAKNKP